MSSRGSRTTIHPANRQTTVIQQRGLFLWRGRKGVVTYKILAAPWTFWWQVLIIITVTYGFIVNFITAYYIDDETAWVFLNYTILVCDFLYMCDVIIHLLHAFWPAVRSFMRAYRRVYFFLTFDVISLVPLSLILPLDPKFSSYILFGKWLNICRIYRLSSFFDALNESMHRTRKTLFILEHSVVVALTLHAFTCLFYGSQDNTRSDGAKLLGYPSNVGSQKLSYDNYLTCWYYCACRLFNVLFGDTFPMNKSGKWLTTILMLVGFVFIRYRFIGFLAWDLVLENTRQFTFVDQYHHMVHYLRFHGAPADLVQQAQQYKLQLWKMKDGILNARHIKKLPLSLQMELIFDINVGHFHDSLLFRDTDESFMRQISLLMRHELYLTGQYIWNQSVVKNGMICVKRGVLEMLSDEDDESPVIAFKEGTVLGELSLFYSIPAKVTVKAATYVELQVLLRTDFMRAMAEQPRTFQIIRRKLEERLSKSKQRETAIREYDKGDSRLIRTRYRPMKVLKNNLQGIEEEDATFVDDSHMYYKDEYNMRQPKFTTEYLNLYQMSENVTTIKNARICLRSTFPWILEPNTDFTQMLDAVHFILVLYACIVYPYVAVIAKERLNWEEVLRTVVKFGLLLNIYIQLTTAINEKSYRRETVREISEVKMSSIGFYLDIISVFPVYIFTDTLDPNDETIAGQLTLLCPILQVWHIWDYMAKWEYNFDSNRKFLCLARFSILFTILCYWSGCFLYFYACPKNICYEQSWMSQLIYWETKVLVTAEAKHEKPTLSSLSFGTAIFTGAGTAGISPGKGDLAVVSFIFILGAYLSCYYIARICSIYLLTTQRKLKFKESMRELFYFLSVNHVSGKIKERVKKFFCVQWYYNNAVSTKELFENMSTNIQREILCIEMVETLQRCPLFQECSHDFLQVVAANTRAIVLPDNEVVQHAADISRDMYILQKGHCNLMLNDDIISIGPNSQFGVLEMLYGLPKVYTVVTTTNCILIHVEYSAMMKCLSSFPDVSHPIMEVLNNDDVKKMASKFEEAKPLTGRMDAKKNRIAQEIKESFVILRSPSEKAQYLRTFQKLGIMRHIRFVFFPGCITPHGIFLKIWCAIRMIVALFYMLTVPYAIAIKYHINSSGNNWGDIFLYADIVVMSYVAYYDERSLLVMHPLLTITYYFRHAFLLDILTVFPFEQMFQIVNKKTDMDLYRINRLLQVSRIIGAFNYWEADIMRTNHAVVLLKFLPLIISIVNLTTAFIFMNSCIPFVPFNSTDILVNCSRAIIISERRIESDISALFEYVHTFYWVFEVFIGCGCTPMSLASSTDIWLVLILMIIGFLFFAFMFGYVASTRSAAAHALLDHNEKTKDLANFLYQENVDSILTMKTLKYFEYVWKRTNGSNPQKICRRLHSALMEDTLVFMYEKTLREVPLFGTVERSFIRVITQHLTEMYFLKGETVIQCRDVQSNIYIIYRGKVDVLSTYNEMITCMGPGGMFGNFTGQSVSCSDVAIFASRSLDLLMIPSQTFNNLVKYYPKIQEPLRKAFEMSKDYILPISINIENADASSEESDEVVPSEDSAMDSKSESVQFDPSHVSMRSSQSNISHAKSAASVLTINTYNAYNVFRPGTWIFQGFGYLACVMASLNYTLVLYEIVTLNDCIFLFWIEAFFDIFFIVKFHFAMHQGYPNKRGELVMEAKKCRANYYRQKLRFWSDLLVVFPFELLGFCFNERLVGMHYLRVNKLLRLKYLLEFYRKTAAELTNNLTVLQTVMTIFIVLLLIHTSTCVWLLSLAATSPFRMIRTMKMHLMEDDPTQRLWDYSTSVYVVTAQITSAGGDEFSFHTLLAFMVMGFCLMCGKLLAATVVATSMQVAYSSKHALTKYERSTMESIDVLKNQGLSDYQTKKFWKYIQQLWVSERGRQLPALLKQTPYVRRCDLMSAMFGQHLRNCFLFADAGEPFLRQLAVALDYTIFFPGNYVVAAGDSEARMHWVASGTVSVVSVRSDLTETTHELLHAGDVFGIRQGLNRGIPHCFSYRAETKVSILSLSLDAWINILPFFPESQKVIYDRAEVLFANF